MPPLKYFRDADLRFMQQHGYISPFEAKIRSRKRDMQYIKKRLLYLAILLAVVVAEGIYLEVHVYLVAAVLFFMLIRGVYSTWVKLAEMETEITYLEAGLVLTRRKKLW